MESPDFYQCRQIVFIDRGIFVAYWASIISI